MSSPTESRLPKVVGSEACWPSIRAHPLPALAPGITSSIIGEHEVSPGARITVEQAIAAYVQEMRALGHEPKTLQWHQTSLRALQRYLWRQFHFADVGQLFRVCLQTWVNDLPLVLSSLTGAMPTVGTVAVYARSARLL